MECKYDKESIVWKVDDDTIHFRYTENWNNQDYDYKAIWSLIKLKWIRNYESK